MNRCTRKWLWRSLLAIALLGLLASCSPYASVEIGAPFAVGPVYVNPRIGIGGFL